MLFYSRKYKNNDNMQQFFALQNKKTGTYLKSDGSVASQISDAAIYFKKQIDGDKLPIQSRESWEPVKVQVFVFREDVDGVAVADVRFNPANPSSKDAVLAALRDVVESINERSDGATVVTKRNLRVPKLKSGRSFVSQAIIKGWGIGQ